MTQKVEVIVSPMGETNVETKGFAGSQCLRASEFVEQALGKQVSETLTPEFYSTTEITESQRESNT